MTEQLLEEYIAQMKKDQAELPDRIFEAEMTLAQKRKENRHKSEPQCVTIAMEVEGKLYGWINNSPVRERK